MKTHSEKIINNLIILPLVLVPLVFTYRATHYYVPKTALVQILGFGMLAAWLLRTAAANPGARINVSRTDAPVLLVLAWTGLSAVWAENRYLSLEEMFFLTSLASIYFVVSKTRPSLKALSAAVSGTALAVSVYGLLQFLGFDFLQPPPRQAVSTLGNVNFAGEFVAAAMFFTAGIFMTGTKKEKIFSAAAGSLQLAYLMATGARGGWIGLAGGAIVFFVIVSGKGVKTSRLLIYILSGLAASLVLISIIGGPETLDSVAARAYSVFDMEHPSVLVRFHVWQSALEIIKENPAIGAGAGNMQIVYPLFRSLEEYRISGTVTQVARAHNDYIETAVDLGIIGLGLFLWILAEAFRALRQNAKKLSFTEAGIAGATACILASALFGFPLNTPSTALLFWTGLGIISRRGPGRGRPRPVFPGNPAVLPAAAVILLVFVIFHSAAWFAADTRLKKALLREEAGDWMMMKEELLASTRYYYPNIQTHHRLAGAYIRLGDIENTYAQLNALLELHPNHPWAHRALGQIYLQLRQEEKGFRLLERAAALNPVFISYLGRAHLAAGNIERAEHELYRQIKLDFADEHTYFYLGELYGEKGEPGRALRAYRRALEINPDMQRAQEKINKIKEEMTDG